MPAESLPPSSLRSVLEEKARAAGIGTAFITPAWWAAVKALHDRDGVTAKAIVQAFDVMLTENIGKACFFATDFPKYAAAAIKEVVADVSKAEKGLPSRPMHPDHDTWPIELDDQQVAARRHFLRDRALDKRRTKSDIPLTSEEALLLAEYDAKQEKIKAPAPVVREAVNV
jgi:hypothetical protein